MQDDHRSGCPINLTMEALGDRWSLIVIQDVMSGNQRSFRDLLTQSRERIRVGSKDDQPHKAVLLCGSDQTGSHWRE